MMNSYIVRAFLFLAVVAAAQSAPLALVGGRLIDGFGGHPLANSVVLIENDRVTAVGTVGQLKVPADAEVISTEGMDVLPGLWDCHVHTMILGHSDYAHWDKTYPARMGTEIMPAAAHQLLMAGITSARDLGGPLKESISVRDRINRGEIPGPTLYVAGPFIQHEPYPGTEYFRWGVKGAADARAKVKQLAEAGVNIIKMIDQDQMTIEEVKAVVDEAHAHKLPVVAHAHRPEEIRRGVAARVDCFEHTGRAGAPRPSDDALPTRHHRTTQQSQLPYYQIPPLRSKTVAHKFKQLQDSGVVMLIGTDSGIPMKFHNQSTWHELVARVNPLGVDGRTAIRAATSWPAVMMKVDKDYGSLSEGKFADVIAVRGDVLRHIDLLQHVDLIIKHGKRVK